MIISRFRLANILSKMWLAPVCRRNLQSLSVSAKRAANCGVRSFSKSSITPRPRADMPDRFRRLRSFCPARSAPSATCTRFRNNRPAGVRPIGRLRVSINSTPTAKDKLRSCCEAAGTDRPISSAASDSDPVRAMTSKVSRLLRLIPLRSGRVMRR